MEYLLINASLPQINHHNATNIAAILEYQFVTVSKGLTEASIEILFWVPTKRQQHYCQHFNLFCVFKQFISDLGFQTAVFALYNQRIYASETL